MSLRPGVAKPASIKINALKSVAYTAALWAVFLFSLPAAIYWAEARLGLSWTRFEPGSWRVCAVVVFCGASLIGFWSGYTLVTLGDGTPMPLECTRHLVIAGPYRYIRNPMSAMGITQGLAVGIFLGSCLVLAYALAGALLWNYVMRTWEERDLAKRFGSRFERYRNSVPCWLPRLTPYQE